MSSELFEALNLLEKERGIQVDFMVDKITKAILTACQNSYGPFETFQKRFNNFNKVLFPLPLLP